MKAVLFDMDGVIFDSERIYLEAWIKIGKENNLINIEDTVKRCIGVTAEKTRDIFLNTYDCDYEPLRKEVSAYFHHYADKGLPVKGGTVELLSFLKDKNIPMVICSSTKTDIVKKELSDVHLLSYFEGVIGGDQVTHSKPDPEIFLKGLDYLNVGNKEALVIEDSLNGVKAAKAASIPVFMVPDLVMPTDEIKNTTPIYHSLLEVKDYLEDII